MSEEKKRRTEPHTIYLNLTENYAPTWKSWDGVREFVQNWYDGVLGNLEECSPPPVGRKHLSIEKARPRSCTASNGARPAPHCKLVSIGYSLRVN